MVPGEDAGNRAILCQRGGGCRGLSCSRATGLKISTVPRLGTRLAGLRSTSASGEPKHPGAAPGSMPGSPRAKPVVLPIIFLRREHQPSISGDSTRLESAS